MPQPLLRRSHYIWAIILLCPLALGPGTLARAADKPVLKLVRTIALKGPAGRLDHLALDAKHKRLFVANMANRSLDIVDLKAGKLVKQIPGQKGIQGVAYAPDLNRIFVGLGEGGICNVFDGATYKRIKALDFVDNADNVRYDARTQRVYLAHGDKALAVFNAKNYDVLADIQLPGSPEAFQLEKERPRLYLNIPSKPEVVAIDTKTNKIIGHYPLTLAGGNYPLAIDETNGRLFVGCRRKPIIVIMGSDSGKEITSVDIPGDIDDLYYDAKRKRLCGSCGDGFIAVIDQKDADSYKLLAKIATAKGARTCLFDARTGRLYLVVPRQPKKKGPEIWVYQAQP